MQVQLKKAGLATKLLILVLMVAMTLALLSLQGKLEQAQKDLDALNRQVQAQTEINAGLADEIANGGGDENIYSIARERLGLVEPGEKVFVDANH